MNKLFKSTLIYTTITISQKTISLLLIPAYTRFVKPEELGLFSVIQSYSAFFIVLISFGLDESALYFLEKDRSNPKLLHKRLSNTLTFYLLIASSIILISLSIALFTDWVKIDVISASAIVWIISAPFYQLFQKMLRVQAEPMKHALFIASYSIAQTFLIVLLVFVFELQSKGLLAAFALTSVSYAIYAVIKLTARFRINLEFGILTKIFSFSKHIYLNHITSWGLSNLLVVSLGFFSSNFDVGIYTALSIFSLLFIEFSKISINAFQPFFYRNLASLSGRIQVKNIVVLLTIASTILAIFVFLLSKLYYHIIIGSIYSSGKELVSTIVLLGVLNFIILIIDQIASFRKSTVKLVSRATVFGFLMNLILILCFQNIYDLELALHLLSVATFSSILLKCYIVGRDLLGGYGILNNLLLSVVVILALVLFKDSFDKVMQILSLLIGYLLCVYVLNRKLVLALFTLQFNHGKNS